MVSPRIHFAGRAGAVFCLAWVLSAFVLAQEAGTEPPLRPNIVLVLVDDLGWRDTGVPLPGVESHFRTPNLKFLASQAMGFSSAYASAPVCTPTRAALLTGRAPARSHITWWTLHKGQDTSRAHPRLAAPAWQVDGLQPEDGETLPGILRQVGYTTILAGKAHFGALGTPGADPRNLGFDVNIAGHAAGAPGSYRAREHFEQAGRQGKAPGSAPSVWDVPGLENYHGHDLFLTECLALEATNAMRASAAAGKPFYLHFAPYAVHMPITANERFVAHFSDLDGTEAAYASMVEGVDAALGAILACIEQLGAADHTIVIFHSDNGGLSAHGRGAAPDGGGAHHHNAPLRSGKGSAYEGGVRVPMWIAWPGITDREDRAGSTCDVPVVSHDLFPTVLSLAGLQTDHGPEIDGRDLTPLLTGRDWLFQRSPRSLFWHQPHRWGADGPGIEPFSAVRTGPWKLIYFHDGPRFELYNLSEDPGERTDLASKHPDQAAILVQTLDQWLKATGAQLSIDKQTGEAVPGPAMAWQGIARAPQER
ncbi:MAG: sulfatase [Planctomycetota bacterium]